MWAFRTLCDEFYVATRLFLKLDLNPSRETLLHFCEQVRRAFPGMTRFRRRANGAAVLEEEPSEDGQRRYLRLDTRTLRFGHFAPPDRDALTKFAKMVLTHAPVHLSLSDLDYDSIQVVYGFDLEYNGNHDELVAETLLCDSRLHAALAGGGQRVIDCRPSVGIALTPDCTTQAYLDLKGRTSMYELRRDEYEAQLLSVYLTVRRYFRSGPPSDLTAVYQELLALGEDLSENRVVPQVVQPLREAIATHR